jgi:hypothetical protein
LDSGVKDIAAQYLISSGIEIADKYGIAELKNLIFENSGTC